MVTSIVLTGMYNIGISATNKIKTPDGVTIETKDIPFVRYRFNSYGQEELDFIAKNKKRFNSVHVVEIGLDENTVDLIEKLDTNIGKIGKLIYIDVTDTEVNNGFSDETEELLEGLEDIEFDRLIIRDKSTTLFPMNLVKLKKQIKSVTNIREDEIGVCGGPCCFIDGNACLTAVKAREIMAKYSEIDNSVLPSANHEGKIENLDNKVSCVNSCGCIRYHIFDRDIDAPASKSSGSNSAKKITVSVDGTDKTVEAEVKEKKKKVQKAKGYTEIDW